MRLLLAGIMIAVASSGCARLTQEETISSKLPLSIRDIEEIRSGDDSHKSLFEPQNRYEEPRYHLFTSPELSAYVTQIGLKLARHSERPDLPYRFFIIDTDEVDLFGLAGGRVYITRGFFNFIESESELAGGIAHELGHLADFQYAPPPGTVVRKGYNFLVTVADQGGGFAGAYGSAAQTGLKAVGTAAPMIKKRFNGDLEKKADDSAIRYMVKAGYDPRGLKRVVDKLSEVKVEEVGGYVDYMKGHPPFEGRRNNLRRTERIKMPLKQKFVIKDDKLTAQAVPGGVVVEVKAPNEADTVQQIAEVASSAKTITAAEAPITTGGAKS